MATKPRKKKSGPSLEEIVGTQVYQVWVDMLRRLVPDGRTHRLAPTVAAMLQYATALSLEKEEEAEEGSALYALVAIDGGDPDEVQDLVMPLLERLFKDAEVEYQRRSARGHAYSIAEDAVQEYIRWYDMPWE